MTIPSSLNPDLHRLLAMSNMDRTWVKGEGVWLFDENGRRFLDCYGQYGAVALGHNAPRVQQAVEKAFRDQIPAMVQPYRAPNAIRLADRLSELAPGDLNHCVFTNSGAETVEAAIKAVRVKTGRDLVVSFSGSYHGKTLGALALSRQELHGSLFGPSPAGFQQIPFGDIDAFDALLHEKGEQVAGLFVEPIQGERGVYPAPEGFLQALRERCTQHGIALVFDEIQTGLGRTGKLFCCEHSGVVPDVMLIAKGLSGGLFPIGACLISEAFWDYRFALCHSSTFANNNVSCAVGLAVLDVLFEDGLIENAAKMGDHLLSGLRNLANRYPSVICEIRGQGLMGAFQLTEISQNRSMIAAYAQFQDLLGYWIAGTIAEKESILVLPTLVTGSVLRVAPPLIINQDQVDQALAGFDSVFKSLEENPTASVLRAIWHVDKEPEEPEPEQVAPPMALPPVTPRPARRGTYTFLIHYTCEEDVFTTDPGLRDLSEPEVERFLAKMCQVPPGVVLEAPTIRSATGKIAEGHLIALPLLPKHMVSFGRARTAFEVKRAVSLAADIGSWVVGLGGFTSVFTRGGTTVAGTAPVTTTGNSLTAAMAFAATERVANRRGISLEDCHVGVVGARGSVGSLCAMLLARAKPKEMTLVGNPRSGTRHLGRIRPRLEQYHHCKINLVSDFSSLADCDIILSATSAAYPVLDHAPLKPGTIICDVAKPPDAKVLRDDPNFTVIDGGLVALPDPEVTFGPENIQGFPKGIQLACLAETILLTLADETQDRSIGEKDNLEEVDYIIGLAETHGFGLAEPAIDALDIAAGYDPYNIRRTGRSDLMSDLKMALNSFVELYHANEKLVGEQADWDCSIALYTSDTDETVSLRIANGSVAETGMELEEVDLLVTSEKSVLLDVLELRRDPNEPYMFGELTVQGPEAHFMRLDYIMTMLSPV